MRTYANHRLVRLIESPVFIVANVRSGTTALLNALKCHPAIMMADKDAPSLHLIGRLAAEYCEHGSRREYFESSCALSSRALRSRLRSLAFATVWGEPTAFGLNPYAANPKRSYWQLGRRVLRWGAKAFPEEHDAAGLCWLMPRAVFVYLVRNGIEVVHSMGEFPSFRQMSFADRCELWANRVFAYRYLHTHPRALLLRHETLLADPHGALKPVLEKLALPACAACGDYAASYVVHPLGDESTTGGSARDQIAARGSPWLSWSEEERGTFVRICGEAMGVLGYDVARDEP